MRAASRGQAQPGAKAKAKAKAKAQAARHAAGPRTQGQEPPWRKTREGSRPRSPTGGRSGGRRDASGGAARENSTLHVDAKRVKDDVDRWDVVAQAARLVGFDGLLGHAEAGKQQALKAKAAALPPHHRVEHLRKRLRQAEEELARRSARVETTELEIDRLQARLRVEVEERDDQYNATEELKVELQGAEDQLNSQGEPKPVGRQVQGGNDWLVGELQKLKARLETAGGSLSDDISHTFDIGATGIAEAYQECVESRRRVNAQEAADHKLAYKLQNQEFGNNVGDKRARDDDAHDSQGDNLMGGEAAETGATAGESSAWRLQVKTGKVRIHAAPTPAPPMPSATERSSETPLGPIATVPRGRQPSRTADRDRSPRRPRASGTPAASGETGTLAAPPGETSAPAMPSTTEQQPDGGITPAVSSSLSP